MKQKAQVTLFIVFVIAVLSIVLIFVLGSNGVISILKYETFKTLTDAEKEVKNAVQECLKMQGEEALKLIALQGRIYTQDFFTYKNIHVYYANNPITKQQLEEEMEIYINQNFESCTSQVFGEFKKRGLELNLNNFKSNVIIAKENVQLNLNYPLEIKLKDSDEKASFSEFIEKIVVNLEKLHDISTRISNQHKQNNGLINMTYLDSLDVETIIIPYKDATLFILEDSKSQIKNLNYAYSFALK